MTFSDDDLKRLKETKRGLSNQEMAALLARLEAAEMAVKQAHQLKELVCEFADKECANATSQQIEIFEVCEEAWRKEAGK